MALEPEDREDLLAEASGLPDRGQFRLPDRVDAIVVGFRDDGSASWFFGPDPVFQFDPAGRLRRVYLDGVRYGARSGRLVRIDKTSAGGRIRLSRTLISEPEAGDLLQAWQDHSRGIAEAVETDGLFWEGTSQDVDALQRRVLRWFAALPSPPMIAMQSRLPAGRRGGSEDS